MSFEPRSEADLVRLIEEYPLAWVVSTDAVGFTATPLPLLCETDSSGRIVSLLGHFALSNPQVALLRTAPRAAILFMGPHAYISPTLVSKPDWGPTWNYASARFDVDIEFLPEENDRALERLVAKMEGTRDDSWTIARLGPRYATMVRRIVAFRAHVRRAIGRFKLGQDESRQTLAELLVNLDDAALVRWMRMLNSTDPPESAP